jgi:hypothetical protein
VGVVEGMVVGVAVGKIAEVAVPVVVPVEQIVIPSIRRIFWFCRINEDAGTNALNNGT